MNKPEFKIKLGKDLTAQELSVINSAREKEFPHHFPPRPIIPGEDNEEWLKEYFLVYEGGELVAFCRLHEVEVGFLSREYSILGVATVIANRKGEGYGKFLMQNLIKYIDKSGKTALGFCQKRLLPFYQKSGFAIMEEGIERLVFEENGQLIHKDFDHGYFYFEGQDNLFGAVLRNGRELIFLGRKHW